MTMRGARYATLMIIAAAGLAGCYENPREVTLYEPGIYKGTTDPLLKELQKPALQQRLEERFDLVQTDR